MSVVSSIKSDSRGRTSLSLMTTSVFTKLRRKSCFSRTFFFPFFVVTTAPTLEIILPCSCSASATDGYHAK